MSESPHPYDEALHKNDRAEAAFEEAREAMTEATEDWLASHLPEIALLFNGWRDTVRSTYADRIGQPPSEADLPYCEIDSLYREAVIAARELNEKKGR